MIVAGVAVLSWQLLGSDEDEEEDLSQEHVGNIKSVSKGLHVIEGQVNATTIFSGFSWWEEVITVCLILLCFVVYKIVKHKCYPPPTTVVQTEITTAAPSAPTPPVPPPSLPMQQLYPGPPPSYYPLSLVSNLPPPPHQYTGYADYVKQKKKVNASVIDVESSDDCSSTVSDTSIPQPEAKVTTPVVADKKRRMRKKKPVVDNKENVVKA